MYAQEEIDLDAMRSIVKEHMRKYPHHGAYIGMAISDGIEDAFREERNIRANMELCAAVLVFKKYGKKKDTLDLLKSKLSECRDKLVVNWDWLFNEEMYKEKNDEK